MKFGKLQTMWITKKKCYLNNLICRLGFKVRVFNDFRAHEILEKLEAIKNKNHKDADCLCVVVLTHGSEGYLWARDKKYKVKELWEPFTANNCPSLKEKPKLFIIQVSFSNVYLPILNVAYLISKAIFTLVSYSYHTAWIWIWMTKRPVAT